MQSGHQKTNMKTKLTLLCVSISLVLGMSAYAQTVTNLTYTGVANNVWNNTGDWSPAVIPSNNWHGVVFDGVSGARTAITIPNSVNYTPGQIKVLSPATIIILRASYTSGAVGTITLNPTTYFSGVGIDMSAATMPFQVSPYNAATWIFALGANQQWNINSPTAGASLKFLDFTARTGNLTVDLGASTLTANVGLDSGNAANPMLQLGGADPNNASSIRTRVSVIGTGGIVKIGPGILLCDGNHSYSGPTTVSNGTMYVNGSLSSSTVSVKAGATFGGQGTVGSVLVDKGGKIEAGQGGTGTLTLTSLTLGSGASDLTTNSIAVAGGASISGGTVVVNGTNYLNVTGSAPTVGVYNLITYSGSTPFANLRLGTLPYGVGAYLQDSGSVIQLNVTNVTVEPGTWVGNATGTWNLTNSLDWKGATTGNPAVYYDADVVTFDDTATNFTVAIVTNVTPSSVTIAAAGNYLFTGSGAIRGGTALTLNGSGTLTLANSNSYVGGTVINSGALQIGAGGTSGSVSGNITDNSTLVFNRSDAVTYGGTIIGPGAVVKQGAGTLTLTVVNPYTGGTTVSNGTLALVISGGPLGSPGAIRGSLTIGPGATLLSSVNNSLGSGTTANLVTSVTDSGTFIHAPTNSVLTLPTLTLNGGWIGATNSLGGGLSIGGNVSVLANANPSTIGGVGVTLRSGTTFTLSGGATPYDLVISAVISGSASLTESGTGTLLLSANNTYSGATTISGGTVLQVGAGGGTGSLGTGAVANSGTVIFNLTNTCTLANSLTGSGDVVVSNGTLAVSGPSQVAANNMTVSPGATLVLAQSPPATASFSTLTLGTGSTNALVASATPAISIANADGFTVGGPVTIRILSPLPAPGVYDLIDFSGSIGGSGFGALSLVIDNPRASATLITNAAGTAVQLNVIDSGTLTWMGGIAGLWNLSGGNEWKLASSGTPTGYLEKDTVAFDGTATSFTVNLATNVNPGGVTVSGTSNYLFTGSGTIGGGTALTLNGPGTLTLANSNSYAGGTFINDGTLQLGNGGVSGSVIGNISDNGTLVFNRSDVFTNNSGIISGTGGVVQQGSGTVILNQAHTFSGGTTVNGGTLNLSYNSGASGTLQGTLTVNSNATVVTAVGNALGYSGSQWVQTINLNFGTLETAVANTDNGWGTTINMTGGTLGSTVANGRFSMGGGPVFNVTGTNVASVISANLTVRDASPGGIVFNITRGTTPSDLNITGNLLVSGTGGITLNGNGIMQLSGNNTYSGATTVNEGKLVVTGMNGTGTGDVTLADNTELDVVANGINPTITNSAATFNLGAGSGTNTLGFAALSSTTVAPISVANLVVYDPVTVNISSMILPAVGQYPLIKVSGSTTENAVFTLGSLPTGVTANLVDDTAGASQSVYLNVTAVASSTDAYLTGITLTPVVAFTPAFNSNISSGYMATENYGTGFTVTVTNADTTATNQLTYNGSVIGSLTSAVPSGSLGLNPNPGYTNLVSVRVMAQDGVTVRTYTVNVVQLPSQTKPVMTSIVNGTSLTLNWPLANLGYRLLAQTNNLAVGISSNTNDWATVSGSAATNRAIITIDPAKRTEFYRLVYP